MDWDILRGWGPGIAVGAVIGVLAASALRTEHLQALFGLLSMVIGINLGLGKSELRLGDAMPKGLCRAALSPSVGLLSVLVGIGGGSTGVPLMSLYNILIHRAVATTCQVFQNSWSSVPGILVKCSRILQRPPGLG